MMIKMIAGKYKYPVEIIRKQGRIWFNFAFNRPLMEEIKAMAGARWHGYEDPPIKQWSVTDCPRNNFQLEVLQGKNPYQRYDVPLLDYTGTGVEYPHQIELIRHGITRQYCIIAAEMSTGKTLSAIRIMEYLARHKDIKHWYYVAPRSALISVQEEFDHWRAMIRPEFMTYEGLVSTLRTWPSGQKPPQGLLCDEASRCKTPTAQRTEAVMHLANSIRKEWNDNGAVILMSGTPAPKGPTDWWSLTEIACPGFLREGDINKFRKRLAVMSEGQTDAGINFPKLVSWRDDPKKCNVCGKEEKDFEHDMINPSCHGFVPSVNEVALLNKRLSGLVATAFKKDVQKHLPEKIFKIVRCKIDPTIINAAKLLTVSGHSAIKTLTLLRELSDGFQYQEEEVGTQVCPSCSGEKTRQEWKYVGPDDEYDQVQEDQFNGKDVKPEYFEPVILPCGLCNGEGETLSYNRVAIDVPCQKDSILEDIIDQHEDVGRLVCYAAFTGSVDRCAKVFCKNGWAVIRVDGRGWNGFGIEGSARELYSQWKRNKDKRIAFVAQPGAGGMGLNLQESPTIVFYSNDFNGESRMQALERTHRPGMDVNRGCTIIDIVNLPTDELVLSNLHEKKRLQHMSMSEIKAALSGA